MDKKGMSKKQSGEKGPDQKGTGQTSSGWKRILRNGVLAVLILAAVTGLGMYLLNVLPRHSVLDRFAGDGFAIVGDGIRDRLEGKSKNINAGAQLAVFTMDSGLTRSGSDYYIGGSGLGSKRKLNSGYPVFVNEGTYLYLYHERFLLVTDEFLRLSGKQDIYLSNGMMFNRDQKREGSETILMIGLPDGLFMNAATIRLESGNTKQEIPMHSILSLSEGGISYCIARQNGLEFQKIEITNRLVKVTCGDKQLSYDVFLEKLNKLAGRSSGVGEAVAAEPADKDNATKTAGSGNGIDVYPVDAPLYQFFMGRKYEYSDRKTFFRTKDGYFMETGGDRFMVYQAPFYFSGEKKLLLPCDYVLVQPKLSRMNRLPALSEVRLDSNAVYTVASGKMKTYSDLFLFDGTDHYVFFDTTVLTWGETSVTISPLSHVTAEKDGAIGVYDYQSGEQCSYRSEGDKGIIAALPGGMSVNLKTDVLIRNDGQEEILFSKPSMLTEAE